MDDPTHPGEHEFRQTIHIDVFYPDHAPRKASARFERTRHHIISVLQAPCERCGTRDNLELHHWYLEWAYSEAIDWDKVRADHPGFDWGSFVAAEDFIDSAYNLRVLCADDHRGPNGIHSTPFPIYNARKYLKAGFIFSDDHKLVAHDPSLQS